ncbi:GT2 family glycosyltransferase [Frondihabitans sp. PhB188]|uniref:glycosyltransferase family 2 protein n=1 Tax=Frondihabitans sp. PhB188 TaxID=2485200 RepID=UPI000F47B009|nr:glycosyltransferase [Frondihabitans sp. PhB188]ROQ38785.1 GT2 family glycosyltransferase [Frondihabitans sp. PhB188]
MTAPAPFGRGLPGNRWDLLAGERPAVLPSVSVVVPYYRQQAELDRTLAALARQTYPAELLDVVVVDDGSPEAPVVADGVRVVRQEDDGFRLAAARNLGVRSSRGDILCFLDADTSPEPEYVARLTRLVALAPETVAVGRRRHADFSSTPVGEPIEAAGPAAALPEPEWLRAAYVGCRDLLDSDSRSYRFVIGAVTACSRWFFEQVGGYDESFTEYGGEDWEWAHRAWIAGALFAHEPDAVAWHDGADWAGRDSADRLREKNAETLTLASTVPVRGSAGFGVIGARPDVVVTLASASSPARAFVCVDSVLTALPRARVVVPAEHAGLFGADPRVSTNASEARVEISFDSPVRIHDATALIDAVEAVGTGELGSVHFARGHGTVVIRVDSRRARLRHGRWPGPPLFVTRTEPGDWAEPLTGEPRLAAYLGGWV